jgi:zinc transport system ATP-binding protein
MTRSSFEGDFLIAARHLNVTLAGSQVLSDVHIAVKPREIVVLIGPNGSGKTTLLKALLGLVSFNGTVKKKPGLKIGYVPQNFTRDSSLPLTVRRLMTMSARGDIAAALSRTSSGTLIDHQVATLSGGELARVLLARAIAQKPDLIVLDEPLAGVDVAGEAALYHLIAQLRDEIGCGVLLVSHDLHVVMAQATRVICLNRHICCEGAAGAVVRDPAFAELFGAHAAADLGLYAHEHDHAHAPSGDVIAAGVHIHG